ncbi:MAG: hypothetical protein QOI06_2898 [Nocardioidaceae bacterium]|jgi:uncharacterized RDD family membrane protein YckC|nr:hypothetical protein [Nocardioidaceae bacterium]
MAPIAGWYDDPRDASRLRYWDGDAWTDHVAPRVPAAPPAAQVPQWQYPGAPQSQQQDWRYGAPVEQQQQPQQWQPQQAPGWPPVKGPTTPDGVRITSWVKRLLARILDGFIVFFASVPFTGYFIYRYFQAISDQVDKSSTPSFFPTGEVLRWELWLVAVLLVLQVGYETFSLYRWGATPGKRILKISVRTWEQGGRLPWSVIGRRVGFIYGLSALGLVPVVGLLTGVVGLLDYLWPLWDNRRQALHDKVAGTVVVEGPRQRPMW